MIRLVIVMLGMLFLFTGCASRGAYVEGEGENGRYFVNTDENGVALQGGHDPVAFFTEGKPVKGASRFEARHEGARYWFASEANLRTFEADPHKYTPAYGGYCGYAASVNRISPIDVKHFQIIDGRLVLQHNQKALDLWNQNVPANIAKADSNWPSLFERNARGARVLVNTNSEGLALDGHDPVGYFTEHRPVLGKPEFEANYNGARYLFASMENRVTFENDPAKYAPAYGGYCGYAASINRVSPVNVHIFQIIDGRLVLQHTPKAYRLFNEDAEGALVRADANWPALVAKKGE
jgi:YHS domain-containing protein